MTALKSLTFTTLPKIGANPVIDRRANIIARLEEQKLLLNDPTHTRIVKMWVKKDGGENRCRKAATRVAMVAPGRKWSVRLLRPPWLEACRVRKGQDRHCRAVAREAPVRDRYLDCSGLAMANLTSNWQWQRSKRPCRSAVRQRDMGRGVACSAPYNSIAIWLEIVFTAVDTTVLIVELLTCLTGLRTCCAWTGKFSW